MGWLSGLFGKKDAGDDFLTEEENAAAEGAAMFVPGSSVAEARDLVNRCAFETLGVHGIPREWVKFEILTLSDANKAYFQLQVTLKHWDGYLLLHSYAFEQSVMNRIREKNLSISRGVRAVLWRVAPDAGCPYEQMPPTVAWTADAIAQRNGNPQMFKDNKPRPAAAVQGGVRQPAMGADAFQDTLQVDHDSAEAEEALRRIMEARQNRQS